MRYLLGTLLVNFQLLWQPTQGILASHASADGDFWGTLVEHMTLVHCRIGQSCPPLWFLPASSSSPASAVLDCVSDGLGPFFWPPKGSAVVSTGGL